MSTTSGGGVPRWSPKGNALFYIDGERWLTKVTIARGEPGASRPIMQLGVSYQAGRSYTVASDGRLLVRVSAEPMPPIIVFLNWTKKLPR